MATHILQQVRSQRPIDPSRLRPSYEEVFDSPPRIAPIPWQLIPRRRIAIVAGVFLLWWAAFGYMVVISAT